MEKKICLSIDQMQKLKELGISTKDASMCWIRDGEGNATAELHDEYCYEMSFMKPVPAFILQDILELMPFFIQKEQRNFFLMMKKFNNQYDFSYTHPKVAPLTGTAYHENAIDAAFEMLCWLGRERCIQLGIG